jgi:hypothetical protein
MGKAEARVYQGVFGGAEEKKKLEKKEERRSNFELIRGGRGSEISIGSVRIVAAPEDQPPFPVEAIVFEEDTYLVLSADWGKIESDDHPLAIMVEALETEPEKPGRVVVYEENPLRFLAVVHDLDQEPSWREDWIEKALEEVFREAERRKLQRIALPFLGTKHGSLGKERFAALFRGFLKCRPSPYHLRVWLVLPGDSNLPINDWLAGD